MLTSIGTAFFKLAKNPLTSFIRESNSACLFSPSTLASVALGMAINVRTSSIALKRVDILSAGRLP